jgi:hypothetical protein
LLDIHLVQVQYTIKHSHESRWACPPRRLSGFLHNEQLDFRSKTLHDFGVSLKETGD